MQGLRVRSYQDLKRMLQKDMIHMEVEEDSIIHILTSVGIQQHKEDNKQIRPQCITTHIQLTTTKIIIRTQHYNEDNTKIRL